MTRLGAWGRGWRVAVLVTLMALVALGSLRLSDDAWPFGPMSQYAFSPADDATIVITRVEGAFANGQRFDLPLNVESSGIGRAEVEARIPAIEEDPSLLRAVADGWQRRHPELGALDQVWLVQDETRLVDGRKGPTKRIELATWVVTE